MHLPLQSLDMRLEDGFGNKLGNDLLTTKESSVESLNTFSGRVYLGELEVNIALDKRADRIRL